MPVTVKQDEPRLHFTTTQVIEGACEPPRCDTTACTDLIFPGLFRQLEVTNSTVVSPPDTRCRFQISSAEGESLDVVFSLADSSPFSFCCNTGLRKFTSYSWSASANGVDLGAGSAGTYYLPTSFDGGVASTDAATPSYCDLADGRRIQSGAAFADGCNCCVCTSSGRPACQGAYCAVDSGATVGSCTSDADCVAQGRLLCAFDPGCDSPRGTCLGGNGICDTAAVSEFSPFEYCGCDGVTYSIISTPTDARMYPYKPYKHYGACP